MPLKVGTTEIIRLYTSNAHWVQNDSVTGLLAGVYTHDPLQLETCPWDIADGDFYVTYGSHKYEGVGTRTEVLELVGDEGTIHKRVTLTFDDNGGSSGNTTQTRTWGVEYVTEPSTPTRTGYSLVGWATTSSASTANVTFPFVAPKNNTTYYAVWEADMVQTVAPHIARVAGTTYKYRAKNNDDSTATILMDEGVNPPVTSYGSVASKSYTGTHDTGIPTMFGVLFTVYATAQASGKTKSDVASLYIS